MNPGPLIPKPTLLTTGPLPWPPQLNLVLHPLQLERPRVTFKNATRNKKNQQARKEEKYERTKNDLASLWEENRSLYCHMMLELGRRAVLSLSMCKLLPLSTCPIRHNIIGRNDVRAVSLCNLLHRMGPRIRQ